MPLSSLSQTWKSVRMEAVPGKVGCSDSHTTSLSRAAALVRILSQSGLLALMVDLLSRRVWLSPAATWSMLAVISEAVFAGSERAGEQKIRRAEELGADVEHGL